MRMKGGPHDAEEEHRLRLLRRATCTRLKKGHLNILINLRAKPYKRDSTMHLSKATGLPYTTTKRYLQDLCRMGAVRRHGGRAQRRYYFELTTTGGLLVMESRNGRRA